MGYLLTAVDIAEVKSRGPDEFKLWQREVGSFVGGFLLRKGLHAQEQDQYGRRQKFAEEFHTLLHGFTLLSCRANRSAQFKRKKREFKYPQVLRRILFLAIRDSSGEMCSWIWLGGKTGEIGWN